MPSLLGPAEVFHLIFKFISVEKSAVADSKTAVHISKAHTPRTVDSSEDQYLCQVLHETLYFLCV